MSHLKNHDEDDTNEQQKTLNPVTLKMSMEMMNKVGKEMMTKTTSEIKTLSMMLQKIFSPGKKLITVDADGRSRDIPVHENDYVNLRVPLRGVKDGLTFNIKALDYHDRSPSSKVDLKIYVSERSHHPNENNHDKAFIQKFKFTYDILPHPTRPGEVHEHFLFFTLESKTGGIFVLKLKPLHGLLHVPKKENIDVVVKKQEQKLMNRLLREHFSVPYEEGQPNSNPNGQIRIPIKELLSIKKTIAEGAADYQNLNRDLAVQYQVRRVERMERVKENSDMRLIMAQEKREELESSLRKKYDELAKKKEEARA